MQRCAVQMLTIRVQRKVPENHSSSMVLCRADKQVVHIPFDITPPIRTQRSSTFCEVYFLAGIAIMKLKEPVSSHELIALCHSSSRQFVAIRSPRSNGRLRR